jgi:hypothetical protein
VASGGPIAEVQDECVVVGLLNKNVEIKKCMGHSSLPLHISSFHYTVKTAVPYSFDIKTV